MKNQVSIWLGKFKTIDNFYSYISESFDEDGNISSVFMTEFGIDYIDHDKMESVYDLDIKKYFFNTEFSFSYSDQFNSFLEHIDFSLYNSVICLYEYEYAVGSKSELQMIFSGVFEY